MVSKIGRIDLFDQSLELWDEYNERLDNFFIANNVKDERKKYQCY